MEALRNLQRIQELLVSEIRYGRATLPECCNHVAEHLAEPYREGFVRIYRRMRENTGVVFGQVFREELEECLGGMPLKSADKNCLLELFSDGGFADESMQIRTIEQKKELLERRIAEAERENREKCRMAVGLGAMSGLLLLILLI